MVKNKKAAMELSMSTIVVLVLAMSMLILGLVLVKTIFTGAKHNVDQINDKVKGEIGKLFQEEDKMVIYLSDQKAELKKGEDYGVAFGVRNLIRGEVGALTFEYETRLNSPTEAQERCGVSEEEALKWIYTGGTGSVSASPGETGWGLIRLLVPEEAPLCMVRYTVDVKDPKHPGSLYVSRNFDMNIKA